MKRKTIVVLLVVFAVSGYISAAFAGHWTPIPDQLHGYWDDYTGASGWKATGDNIGDGTVIWDANSSTPNEVDTIGNFSAFFLNVSIPDFAATLRPWSFSDYKKVVISLTMSSINFTGGGGVLQWNWSIYSAVSWFGAASEPRSLYFPGGLRIDIENEFNFAIIANDSQTCTIKSGYYNNMTHYENGTLAPLWFDGVLDTGIADFFDNPILMTLQVYHEGSGHFQIWTNAEDYVNGELPTFAPGINMSNVIDALGQQFSIFGDIYNALTGGFAFIVSMLTLLGRFAMGFLSILPFLGIFWALDVIVTSAQTGSVKPLGNWVMQIWEFARQLWDTLIHFGELVWDAITFWT